jgi:ubiquitin-conjugating enzyme E2 A
LCDPNPNSPANAEAASLYAENRREYNRRIVQNVEATLEDDDDEDEEEDQ